METENQLLITRTYNAPREWVYRAWSEAERLAEWWGPKGCSIMVKKNGVKPGGIFHYGMGLPHGGVMWGLFTYLDVREPEKIVFVNSFSDEDGNIVRSPYHAQWPLKTLTHVLFTEDHSKTTVTLHSYPINATEEEMKIFEASARQMQQGFKGTFDQLEEYLAHYS